jgi:hypothetical protein
LQVYGLLTPRPGYTLFTEVPREPVWRITDSSERSKRFFTSR